MYAVIQIGSSQYKVSEGDTIEINQIDSEEGKSITLGDVLMCVDGKDVRIGQPFLKDVKVTAKVAGHMLGEKMIAFKYKLRKNYARKKGHRQKMTAVSITMLTQLFGDLGYMALDPRISV